MRWKYDKLREFSLLQIATALLLQNATWFIKNCDKSFPKHDDYYNCDSQYKVLSSALHPPTFLKAGAILLVRVPATIITSAWR